MIGAGLQAASHLQWITPLLVMGGASVVFVAACCAALIWVTKRAGRSSASSLEKP